MVRLEKKQCLVLSIVMNVLFAISVLALTDLYYLTGDEYYFTFILSGAEGTGYEAYTAFQNPIWCYFLSMLYKIIPGINWYVTVCLILSFLALTGIIYCFLKKGKDIYGILCSVFFLFTIGKFAYVEFAFTYNAYLYCVAGLVLFFDLKEECLREHKVQIAASVVLMLIGMLTREKCFYAVVPYFVIAIVAHVYKKRKGVVVVGACFLSIVAIFVVTYCGELVYTQNSEWNEYQVYNSVRSAVVDYELPAYEDNREFYESINLSEVEYQMVQAWMLEDYESFDVEQLKKIKEYRVNSQQNTKETVSDIRDHLLSFFKDCSIGFWVVALSVILLVRGRKRYLLEILGMTGVFFLEYFYLFYITKRSNFRGEYGMWLALLVILFYLVLENKTQNKEEERCSEKLYMADLLSVGVVLCALNILNGASLMKNHPYTMDTAYHGVIEYVNSNRQNLYLGEMWTMDVFSKNTNPKIVLEEGEASNIYVTGGCYLRNPRTNQILKKYQVENPIPALIKNDNVYLIAKYNADLIAQYLAEKYDTLVTYQEVASFEDVGVYKYEADYTMQTVKTGDFYEDGWFGVSGHLHVYNWDASKDTMVISYMAREELEGAELIFVVNGEEKRFTIHQGDNTIQIELSSLNNVDIDMCVNQSFCPKKQGESEDDRELSIYIYSIDVM